MLKIGPHLIDPPVVLAPMAGVTDRPFRHICRSMGAGLAVSEMVTCQSQLWDTPKTRLRIDHRGEIGPISVQIAGHDPRQLADAARFNADHGADIIDINMGCPAKKVCKNAAGSALLKNEALVADILRAVVAAVTIPVTLKIRTGWDSTHRNALNILAIAENEGIAALAIHGRTRTDRFEGEAEYHTIAEVKARACIPIIANGDIDSVDKAQQVLHYTQADGIMIGRAALGNPWLFKKMRCFFDLSSDKNDLTALEVRTQLVDHVHALHAFYGVTRGVKIARKHIRWYSLFYQQYFGEPLIELNQLTVACAQTQLALIVQ